MSRSFYLVLKLTFLYAIFFRVSLEFFIDNVSILWPSNAISLAFFLQTSMKKWHWLIFAIMLGYLIGLYDVQVQSIGLKMGFLLANLIEIMPTAILLKYLIRNQIRLDRLRDTILFLLIAVVLGPILSGFTATLMVMRELSSPFSTQVWASWGVGNAVSILMITIPTYYYLTSKYHLKQLIQDFAQRGVEFSFLFIVSLYYLVSEFAQSEFHVLSLGMIFMIFPIAMWAALRFNTKYVCVWTLLVFIFVAYMTSIGLGPFAYQFQDFRFAVFYMHIFSFILGCTTLIISALNLERAKAANALFHLNEKLEVLSNIDHLTNIPNRRCYDQKLNTEFKEANAEANSITLVLIDIDHFKRYNDRYGHLKGDQCLRKLANTLKASLKRPSDMVARIGGEEFACILPNTDVKGATKVIKQIMLNVHQLKLKHESSPTAKNVTVSIGSYTTIPTQKTTMKSLYQKADVALYEAKAKGRNCYVSLPASKNQ